MSRCLSAPAHPINPADRCASFELSKQSVIIPSFSRLPVTSEPHPTREGCGVYNNTNVRQRRRLPAPPAGQRLLAGYRPTCQKRSTFCGFCVDRIAFLWKTERERKTKRKPRQWFRSQAAGRADVVERQFHATMVSEDSRPQGRLNPPGDRRARPGRMTLGLLASRYERGGHLFPSVDAISDVLRSCRGAYLLGYSRSDVEGAKR